MSGLKVFTREYSTLCAGTITFTHTQASCELSFKYQDPMMQKMGDSTNRKEILKAYLKEVETIRLNCTQYMGWGEWGLYKLQQVASSIHILVKGTLTSPQFKYKENNQEGTLTFKCTSDIIPGGVDCVEQYFAEYDQLVEKRKRYYQSTDWSKVVILTGLLGCLAGIAALQKDFFTAKLNALYH